jgi:BASS family bile acid:Na+ symporter
MIPPIVRLLGNRNFVLLLSLILGLSFNQGVYWTEKATLPALVVVMTLSTMGVSGSVFRKPRAFIVPALLGIAVNYVLLGGFLLMTSALLIQDETLWIGFVLMAAVPPGVGVIPFTEFLKGNSTFSLMGIIGCYLGALILMPLITFGFLGSDIVAPGQLFIIIIGLILIPLVLSRVLVWARLTSRIEPVKGLITNWSFFVVIYTIVGLNRELLLTRPISMLPVAAIALASTFLLGSGIKWLARVAGADLKTAISLVLLGTVKNYGLAAGLALALFGRQTAVPCTVSTIFMIVYIIWLGSRGKRRSEPA